jgi:hypothetical protein
MITLVVTILLIVVFLFVTRKRRSEYYEEDIGPSDIEIGPSEGAPVRPRSLVHKLLKGIDKMEKKRTQDVILHDAFLKQVDMKAAFKQGTQDEIQDEIQESVDEELKFIKKYTGLVEDHIYENQTLPENETYDEVAEAAYDGIRKEINTQLMVKGQEYKERQISELALRTEQRQVMDKDVKDTTILKSDLGEGLQVLEDTLPKIEADANAIDTGDLPTSELGTDALFSRGDEAINQSSPFTQRMVSLFASASLEPEDGWNDGNVALATPTVNSTSPQDNREKLIQFSEVGNVFNDYYIVQDPTGPHFGVGAWPREDDEESEDFPENYGKWKKEKVQMKISCGPTSPGDIELGDQQYYYYGNTGISGGEHGYYARGVRTVQGDYDRARDQEASFPRGAGRGNYKNSLGLYSGARIDSIYSSHLYNRPYRTVAEHSGSCVKPMYAETFQKCSDACRDSDECSAFSIDPIFDTERGHHAMHGIQRNAGTVEDEEKYRFKSLTTGPEKFDNGNTNKYKGKYWCKLQKYGNRRFDIGTFSGEAIFAKYEDGYLKDPLIKEHIAKKIDANSTNLEKNGNFEHPKFPRTCQDTPLDFENGGEPRGTTDYSMDGSLSELKNHSTKSWSAKRYTYDMERGLPEDSARYSNAAWTPADSDGVCKNNGKNEKTVFPGRFSKDDEVDPATQIQLGCPVQFIRTGRIDNPRTGTSKEFTAGGWKSKIDRHRDDYKFEDAKSNPYHLGWANHGVEPGSNIVRNKVKAGSDDRHLYANSVEKARNPELTGYNDLVDDDYRSLVLPGTRGLPKCPNGYTVRTENQPYCDPNTLTLSTPNVKCEPILEQGGCNAKESKYQTQCAALNELSCTNHQFSSEDLGLERFEPGGKNAASPSWAPQNQWGDNIGELSSDGFQTLRPDKAAEVGRENSENLGYSETSNKRDPNVGLHAYKSYGKQLGKDHRWNKYTMDGLPASDVCEWKPHTFYDGQVSRETEYDGKQFYVLYKRSQNGSWAVGQPDEFTFQGPKWNWDDGGHDPTFNQWARWFDDKGKIVLQNPDGTFNRDAIKYRQAVLKKMGGIPVSPTRAFDTDFKPTEIPIIYYTIDDSDVTEESKKLAEQAAINYHSGE